MAHAHAHSLCVCVYWCVCLCVCGIIPPEFAANPLNFATAHKSKRNAQPNDVRWVWGITRQREWEWKCGEEGRVGSQSVARQVQFLRRNRFTPVSMFVFECVWLSLCDHTCCSLCFPLARALVACSLLMCACFVLVTHIHTLASTLCLLYYYFYYYSHWELNARG